MRESTQLPFFIPFNESSAGAEPAPMKVPAKSKSKGIDLNKNVVPDLYLSIKPGSRGKKIVFGVVDRNEDGVVDYIFIDSDGDGKQEARILKDFIDGGADRLCEGITFWRKVFSLYQVL